MKMWYVREGETVDEGQCVERKKSRCREEKHEVSAGLCYAGVDITYIPF